MKRLQIPQRFVYENFYLHEIAAVNLSKIYFLKNAKKTCKPNNRDLNRDWIIKSFRKFSRKNLRWSPVLVKLQTRTCYFTKKGLHRKCSPVSFETFLIKAIYGKPATHCVCLMRTPQQAFFFRFLEFFWMGK